MNWQTTLIHITIGLGIIFGLCWLAVDKIIPGSDAFTGLMSLAVGLGVIAGAVTSSSPKAPGGTP